METRNLVIICICIIAIVAVGAVAIAIAAPQDTNLEVLSSFSLYDGEDFKVKLTSNGTGIANQTIDLTIKDSAGNLNNQEITTNDKGIASLTLNGLATGNYIVETSYMGNSQYKSSNITTNLEIMKKSVISSDTSISSSYPTDYTQDIGDYEFVRDIGEQEAYVKDSEGRIWVLTGDGFYNPDTWTGY